MEVGKEAAPVDPGKGTTEADLAKLGDAGNPRSAADVIFGDNAEKKPDEAKPEGDKPAEQTPDKKQDDKPAPDANAPKEGESKEQPKVVEYDLKAPEGHEISAEQIDGVKEFAKANNLTPEAAQAVLNREAESRALVVKQLQDQAAQWVDMTKQDKEIGGDRFIETSEFAKRVVDRFGSDDFKAFVNDPKMGGLGNHPELVRFCSKIYREFMAEDKVVQAGSASSKASGSVADLFYGQTKGD